MRIGLDTFTWTWIRPWMCLYQHLFIFFIIIFFYIQFLTNSSQIINQSTVVPTVGPSLAILPVAVGDLCTKAEAWWPWSRGENTAWHTGGGRRGRRMHWRQMITLWETSWTQSSLLRIIHHAHADPCRPMTHQGIMVLTQKWLIASAAAIQMSSQDFVFFLGCGELIHDGMSINILEPHKRNGNRTMDMFSYK